MSKLLDNLYKNLTWIIIVISIIGYLAYRVVKVDGDIETMIMSLDTWLNIFFVIWLNLNVQTGAINSAISAGIDSQEFKLADELNNKIIKSVNNEIKDFREYVKKLNEEERLRVEEEFLFRCGVDDKNKLTRKQLRKFKRLKSITHDIKGFNLPLYYEMTYNGNIKYESSFNKNKRIIVKRLGKILNGILFGVMSVNIAFNVEGVGEALLSVVVIGAGLLITYIVSFAPVMFRLKYVIPKGVILKNTLYTSYIEYKTGQHKLAEIKEE